MLKITHAQKSNKTSSITEEATMSTGTFQLQLFWCQFQGVEFHLIICHRHRSSLLKISLINTLRRKKNNYSNQNCLREKIIRIFPMKIVKWTHHTSLLFYLPMMMVSWGFYKWIIGKIRRWNCSNSYYHGNLLDYMNIFKS